MIVIVMGVVGAGKTTVGSLLAEQLGWNFADADDYHSPENKRKIHQGVPLTDADREPWLERLHVRSRIGLRMAATWRWRVQPSNASTGKRCGPGRK